ncbi:endolytic transglycosylase MltG [Castellaniella caeni]|uniref:endolytic transglycosylase MltG n=1 Tax=Castellaniella caeni TaxID=266123 RepID=UPI00082F8937|nr:endolytic transglycosylase MltG [Castellaniella caeni]
MKRFLRFSLWLLIFCLAAAAVAIGGAAWWGWKRPVPMQTPVVDYLIDPGTTPHQIALAMQAAGIAVDARAFVWLARLSGRDKLLKAGAYEARQGDTPWLLLERMANGDMTQVRLTFPEGWTFGQMRAALAADDKVRHDTLGLDDAEVAQRLGLADGRPEGRFYPDTYVFAPGTSDLDILRRGEKAGHQVLEQIWAQRDRDLPLQTPYQALILASIIEKETGHGGDRARIAGVFINRLRLGMPLQTDPTVIYGLGAGYQGRLRKKDLEQDTPWNTYTRPGLPPTPIANPGKAALLAAVHPEKHDYLYFVSRGDGTSEFSKDLAAHNRAVGKYILKRN